MIEFKRERFEAFVCPNCAIPTLVFLDEFKDEAFLTREFFCLRCHASILIKELRGHHHLDRPTILNIGINEWKKRENERYRVIKRILSPVYHTGYFNILDYLDLENMSIEELEQQEEKINKGMPLRKSIPNTFKLFICECGTKFLFGSNLDRILCPNPRCRREYRKR